MAMMVLMKPASACGSEQMTNIGFHRPDGKIRPVALLLFKHIADGLGLHLVAFWGWPSRGTPYTEYLPGSSPPFYRRLTWPRTWPSLAGATRFPSISLLTPHPLITAWMVSPAARASSRRLSKTRSCPLPHHQDRRHPGQRGHTVPRQTRPAAG